MYKHLQGVNNSHYRLHTKLIKEICMGTIYIKSNLGITHFAHNYMETLHVASKPKLLKTLAWSGIWTHNLQITCLTLSWAIWAC